MTSRDDGTTLEELLARGPKQREGNGAEGDRGGTAPSVTADVGAVRVALGGILWHAFGRPRQPGAGWWFVTGVELRGRDDDASWWPDLAGFRRRRGEPMPGGQPMRVRPDWACQIISAPPPSTARSAPGAASRWPERVPHLWIADLGQRTLDVHRWTASGYEALSRAGGGATVRANPFPEIAIEVDELFGAVT